MDHGINHNPTVSEHDIEFIGSSRINNKLRLILSLCRHHMAQKSRVSTTTSTIFQTQSHLQYLKVLLEKLARHILVFSRTCRGTFTSMVARNKPCAVILLCHSYRAVKHLLVSTEFWWAHQRAAVLRPALEVCALCDF
ncbi:hypothetical protein BD289DRAFT_430103 [Coniella lustricola]|uniref:Uncharacterized protein n=1 Tax=Coniella lustricola TaxID=2025994 RepID=A0A2T3ACB5_9PEZI|nr:hypothetical protein BD289DRAFT_430103 [Coniella lustricola]